MSRARGLWRTAIERLRGPGVQESPRPAGPGLLAAWRGKDGNLARGLILLGLAGVLLMLFGGRDSAPPEPETPTATPAAIGPSVAPPDVADYADELERELTLTLTLMTGVGNVKVLITLERGAELLFAGDREEERQSTVEGSGSSARRTTQERVTQRILTLPDEQGRAQRPLVQAERKPAVRGVLIVAEGAEDPSVRWMITQAAQTVLDVPANRVLVVPRRR
ncbi:MAG TPA: hypothetical protein VF234_05180 [Limnochordia bacterium]